MRTSRVFFLGALVLSAWGCKGRKEEEAGPTHPRLDPQGRVVLTAAERQAIGLEITRTTETSLSIGALRFGKVIARPQEDVLVTAPITGRLVAPTLPLGATVAAGDVLVTLEPLVDAASRATLEAQRRELAGQVTGARAQVAAREKDLNRVTTLVSSGLATDTDRAQAEAALTAERARVESLGRARAELERVTGGRLVLTSPVGGVLATLATEAGSVIQQGTVVARVVRAGPRWVDLAVPPDDAVGSGYRAVGIAGPVTMTLVARGSVIAGDGTRRDRLEAPPDAATNLVPGATVPVEVLHETQGLVVPTSALVQRGSETWLFVENGEGKYEPRRVPIAARDEARAVVSSGLSAGERVVSQGASSLLGELGAAGRGLDGGSER